ncbi:MAG: tRNA pseudouridine(55) synthase TruB [Geminicoccaceae bacterium]|nr:tRNA pseudouridine(55) synthase TruB [Geminicoccaceae bacterium]
MARTKRRGRRIDGWLCLDKPPGMTSTDVVNQVKRITRAAKAGHGGTLDPIATGVLPVALGEATKTVAYVMDGTKHYRFTARFGEARDTDDLEGTVVSTSEARPDDDAIRAALPAFVGTTLQVPPRYAAVKVAGERAYDLARRGEDVVLEPRPVTIHKLEMTGRPSADLAEFEMVSGRGAYVRAVVRDLGERLGCHAHVAALRRTRVGGFDEQAAISLETLERLTLDDALPQALLSVAVALEDVPSLALTEPQAERLRSGQTIRVVPQLVVGEVREEATIRAMAAGRVVALARLDGVELSPLRVFNSL